MTSRDRSTLVKDVVSRGTPPPNARIATDREAAGQVQPADLRIEPRRDSGLDRGRSASATSRTTVRGRPKWAMIAAVVTMVVARK